MRYLLISVVVSVHVAVIGGALLIQGCGTTRGPVSLPSERPMPPTIAEEDLPPAPPPAVPYHPVIEIPTYSVVSPVVPPVTSSGNTKIHVVAKGDSLSVLAKRYGVTIADIMVLNNITDPNKIRLGQKLKLPGNASASKSFESTPKEAKSKVISGGGSRYVVQAGDSLSRIAQKAGVSVKEIQDTNGLKGDKIFVGQELTIPGGRAISPMPVVEMKPVSAVKDKEILPEMISVSDVPLRSLPPEQAPAAASRNTYTVQVGDDILTVASQHNVSISDLRRVNNLSSDILIPGRTLVIPAAE